MEKWKIAVIIVLVGSLGLFQVLQQKSNSASEPQAAVTPSPAPPNPALKKLIGTQVLAWDIPAHYWVNTSKPLTLDDTKGQVTVIEFWRSQCSHCQEAIPFMSALYTQYAPKGVKFITFQAPGQLTPDNVENQWPTVKSYIKDNGIKYPVAFDENRKLKNQYGVDLYPFILVVDKNGKIQIAQTGHDAAKAEEIAKTLERLTK